MHDIERQVWREAWVHVRGAACVMCVCREASGPLGLSSSADAATEVVRYTTGRLFINDTAAP